MTDPLYKKLSVAVIALFPLLNSCKTESVKPTVTLADTIPAFSAAAAATAPKIPLKNMFGVNAYAWNFLQDPNNPSAVNTVYPANMTLIKTFNQVRHYLDWTTLETTQGSYTYNPCYSGSWNLDAIYQADVSNDITTLVDIKTCPNWLLASYPGNLQDGEDVPAPYGSDLTDPASYVEMGKMAFQFAARYGSNTGVSRSLLTVSKTQRWTNDPINTIKVGLNTVKYIECNNEPDKWWKGPATIQTAAQYAANMSAFYDGNKSKLGKNVGVKNADPHMIVVMGGIATDNVQWVKDMITWCKQNRGYKADGSVNLCFDVINYHYYNNSGGTTGAAPELSKAADIADNFAKLVKTIPQNPQVWITESGYDINAASLQSAPSIGSKSALIVQADWILRSCLLYMKHGISRVFFYQLFDDTPNSGGLYATSGLCEATTRRPAANYILQTTNLMGNFTFVKTSKAGSGAVIDQYTNGSKSIYALYMPTAKGSTAKYTLSVSTAAATLFTLNPTGTDIKPSKLTVNAGKVVVNVSETPVFVSEVLN